MGITVLRSEGIRDGLLWRQIQMAISQDTDSQVTHSDVGPFHKAFIVAEQKTDISQRIFRILWWRHWVDKVTVKKRDSALGLGYQPRDT